MLTRQPEFEVRVFGWIPAFDQRESPDAGMTKAHLLAMTMLPFLILANAGIHSSNDEIGFPRPRSRVRE